MVKRALVIVMSMIGSIMLDAGAATAQLSHSDAAAVEAYRSAIGAAETGTIAHGIEAVYAKAEDVRAALMRVRDDRDTVLESLSDAEFSHLQHELPGLLINREEIVFVKPDPDYFIRFSAAHGDAADRAFFAALKATYPDAVWPIYIEQQTDYSGCTRFGSMSLVDTYRAWSAFRHLYPDRYKAAAQTEVEAILEQLTGSTCACGDLVAVEKGLMQFNRAFPASRIRSKIDQRLQELREHRSDIRAHCISG